jgi:hypothetical protein
MWNGPTWPHANAIVLSAMARTLRATRDARVASPLEKRHFWKLFQSYTQAQYRHQDNAYPWTGEYYRGDDGQWKTQERDYFHSTWLDVLISDVVGIVPRADDMLEVDPLLPPGAVSHFMLDGQYYRGHDVTVVWTDPETTEGAAKDSRRGLSVYVDGKLRASSTRLTRLIVPLEENAAP